jgi:hypothetical protein
MVCNSQPIIPISPICLGMYSHTRSQRFTQAFANSLHFEPLPLRAQFASELNFDDFQSALLTLFEVANLGNWLMVLDAATALAPATSLHSTYLYFFTFRVIIAMIYVPIFVGFVLESIVKNFELLDQENAKAEADERLAKEHQHRMTSLAASKQPLVSPASNPPGSAKASSDEVRFKTEDFDDSHTTPMSPPYSPPPPTSVAAVGAAARARAEQHKADAKTVDGSAPTAPAVIRSAQNIAQTATKRKYRIKLERTHSMIQSAMFDLGKLPPSPDAAHHPQHRAPVGPSARAAPSADHKTEAAAHHTATSSSAEPSMEDGTEDADERNVIPGLSVSGLAAIEEQAIQMPADSGVDLDLVDERAGLGRRVRPSTVVAAASASSSSAAAAVVTPVPGAAGAEPSTPILIHTGSMSSMDASAVGGDAQEELKRKDDALRWKVIRD